MNTEMLAVYVAVAAIVIIPYLAILFFGSSKRKTILKRFKEISKTHALNISEKETWNRHIIGLDEQHATVLFVQHAEENRLITEMIHLADVVSIEIIQKKSYVKSGSTRLEILDVIGLELMMKDHTVKPLYFFDNNIDVSQNYEYEHAEKWLERLRNRTKMLKNPANVAA